MQERKEKAPSSLSSLSSLGQCRSLYCFLLGFVLYAAPWLPAQGCALSLCDGDTSSCSACGRVGQSLDNCQGWELRAEGCLSGTPRPRSSKGSCSADFVSPRVGDLRV